MRNILGVNVVMLVFVATANAGLTLDLTLSDGTKDVFLDQGDSGFVNLQLWAVIAGTDGNNTNEGVQSAYAWIKTTNIAGITGLTGITSQPTRPSTMGTFSTEGTLTEGDLLGLTKTATWSAKTNAGANSPAMTSLGGAAIPAEGEYKIIDANTVAILLGNIIYNYANISGVGTATVNAVAPTWASKLEYAAVYGQDFAGTFQKVTNTSQETVGDPVTITVVPEPSTLALLLTAILGGLLLSRRRR